MFCFAFCIPKQERRRSAIYTSQVAESTKLGFLFSIFVVWNKNSKREALTRAWRRKACHLHKPGCREYTGEVVYSLWQFITLQKAVLNILSISVQSERISIFTIEIKVQNLNVLLTLAYQCGVLWWLEDVHSGTAVDLSWGDQPGGHEGDWHQAPRHPRPWQAPFIGQTW